MSFPGLLQEVASTEIGCFAVLEAGSLKSGCGQGHGFSGGPLEGSFLPLPAPVAPGALGLWPRPSNLCPHLYTASVCFSLLLSRVRNLSLDSAPDQAIRADLMRLSLIRSAEMPFLNNATATGSED